MNRPSGFGPDARLADRRVGKVYGCQLLLSEPAATGTGSGTGSGKGEEGRDGILFAGFGLPPSQGTSPAAEAAQDLFLQLIELHRHPQLLACSNLPCPLTWLVAPGLVWNHGAMLASEVQHERENCALTLPRLGGDQCS